MVDIARLGVTVDTRTVKGATRDLDRMGDQGVKTGQQIASGMAASERAMARASRASTAHTANLVAQGNDIVMMTMAMQDPMMLMMQQGTQVTQVMSQMGGGMKAIRGIGAAFMSMVNPMNLATMAVIGGGAALVQWGISALGASEDADKIVDALERIKDEAGEARDSVRQFQLGLDGSAELAVYDEIQSKLRRIAEIESNFAGGGHRLRTQRQRVESLNAEVQALRDALDQRRAAIRAEEHLADIQSKANRAGAAYMRRVDAEKEAADAARRTVAELQAQADLAAIVAAQGEESLQVAQARLGAERDVFLQQVESREISKALKQELIAAWDAANGVASVDMAGNIIFAADQAARLHENLVAAMAAQGQIIADRIRNNPDALDPRGEGNGNAGIARDPRLNSRVADSFRNLASITAQRRGTGRSRRSGGGGVSAAQRAQEKAYNDLLRARDRILDSLKTAQDRYNEELELADKLLAKGLITQEQYTQHLQALQAELKEMETEAFRDDIESISDALAGAIVQGENLGDSFKGVLQRMASDLLSSNIQGMITSIFGAVGGGGGGGGFLASLFGFSKGAAFHGGRVVPFATGGIVSSPTMFPMSGGQTGLMGEAGPEAIMPLTRGPGGRLGVQASGAPVDVNIHLSATPLTITDGGVVMTTIQATASRTEQNAVQQAMRQVRHGSKTASGI